MLLDGIIDPKISKLIQFLADHADEEFYLRELHKKTNIPLTTLFRLLKKLESLRIVNVNVLKTTKLYSIKKDEKMNKKIIELFSTKKSALDFFIDKVSKIKGVIQVIQLISKDEKKDKANLLILGLGVNSEEIKRIVLEVKEKYNFVITQLVLEPEQYSQMLSMGLYPGKKRILYTVDTVYTQ